jgi:hypothetical protein
VNGFRVRGILDRPSRQSLGMLGIVVEREKKRLDIEGVVGLSSKSLEEGELRELISSGDAQETDGPTIEEGGRPHAALWVGNDFAEKAARLRVALPPLPESALRIRNDGMCWIGPTQHVWRVLDSWVVLAFRRSVREEDAELARLMAWALPDRQETRAAIWYTMRQARQANLDWWARLDRDLGEGLVAPHELASRYDRLVGEYQSHLPQPVVGFCAWAKGGDNEIANELCQRWNVQRISFGQWLRERVRNEGIQPNRRALQRRGQQMIEKHGALEFCLEVLGRLSPNVPIPNARFVIDGIRHREVLLALKSLIGEDHFRLIKIERNVAERRRLLIEDEQIPPNEVDVIMNDITEREIADVAERADRSFNRDQGVEPIATELASIS